MKSVQWFLRITASLLILFSLNLSAFATGESFPDENIAVGSTVLSGYHTPDAMNTYLGNEKIVENVASAILFETNSDTLMYTLNPDAPMDPASLVKILTALIAVEQGNVEDEITVTKEVLDSVPYDAVSADLVEGEILTLSDLIHCMLAGSANDAAAVIADHICGGQAEFVEEMNRYAQELGCKQTVFMNVHGLYHEQQLTTARDMVRILDKAVENELFCTYFGTVNYTVPATNMSEARELSTGNFLMNTENLQIYYDARVTGGRTGVAKDGTRCLAAAAQNNGMQLISIVLGAEDQYAEDSSNVTIFGGYKETTQMMDAGFAGNKVVQILHKGQALTQYAVENGSNVVVGTPSVDAWAVLPEEVLAADIAHRYQQMPGGLSAPIVKDSKIADVQLWYGSVCVAEADLMAMNGVSLVAASNVVIDDEGETGLPPIVVVLIWVVVAIVALIVLVRVVNLIRKQYRIRNVQRRRRDRRRSK